MIPLNPWEHQNAVKTLYGKFVGGVCAKHEMARIELDILLFLANNPCFDTATDIIEIRYLSKSQVSAAVKLLEEKAYLRKEYADGNRKTAHLKLCQSAGDIIRDGKAAQEAFAAALLDGFSQSEIHVMKQYNERILGNIHSLLSQ